VQPAVYRVAHQRLILSGIRLGLAALGVAGSLAAGTEGAAAGVALALGAGICSLALVTDRRWLLLGRPEAEALPADVRRAPLARAVAEGMLPSTAGVALLAAVSLFFEPLLAAVLAGILAGMGIVGLVSCAEVALWERRTGARLYADADVHTRRYVAPAVPAERTDAVPAAASIPDRSVPSGTAADPAAARAADPAADPAAADAADATADPAADPVADPTGANPAATNPAAAARNGK
jgi:hypothetical protein